MAHTPDFRVRSIFHQPQLAEPQIARNTLERLASFIQPIMRQHRTAIGELHEFYPQNPGLLGLNENGGQRVFVRLRSHRSPKIFLVYEEVLDTLLHELSHNFRGPHDKIFHAKWNEFRADAEALMFKGFSGDAFIGSGQALGGRGHNQREALRQRRAEAHKRESDRRKAAARQGRVLGGFTLGGRTFKTPQDAAAAAAVLRRGITEGCGDATSRETKAELERARQNGFQSRAEEDDANNLAITLALSELEEEHRKRNAGGRSRSPDEGLTWTPEGGLELLAGPATHATETPPPQSAPLPGKGSTIASELLNPGKSQTIKESVVPSSSDTPLGRNGRPISRLVLEDDARRHPQRSRQSGSQRAATQSAPSAPNPFTWSCDICTLENPADFLCCNACGTERPLSSIISSGTVAPQPMPTWLPDSSGGTMSAPGAHSSHEMSCQWCGTIIEATCCSCPACGIGKA